MVLCFKFVVVCFVVQYVCDGNWNVSQWIRWIVAMFVDRAVELVAGGRALRLYTAVYAC